MKKASLDFFELKRDLLDQNHATIYLMYGEEIFLHQLAMEEILKKIKIDKSTVNIEKYYAAKMDYHSLANSLSTMPLGIQKQCIIVKQIEELKADGIKRLDQLIHSGFYAHQDQVLLLFSLTPKIPKELRLTLKKIEDRGVIVALKKLKYAQVKQFIEFKCKENGKYISNDGIYYLQRLTENELSLINNELDKIFCYLGDKDNSISKEHIVFQFFGEVEGNIFDFVDAIGEKKQWDAIRILRKLIKNESHPLSVLAMINRQVKLLLQVKYFKEDVKELSTKLHLPGFVLQKLINQAKNFRMDQLKKASQYTLEAEVRLKNGYFEPIIILEELVINITH